MRKSIISTVAPATLAFATLALTLMLAGGSGTAAQKKTVDECEIDLRVCYKGCAGPAGDLGDKCRKQCKSDWDSCLAKLPPQGQGSTKSNPKAGIPPSGGVAKDPKSPPKGIGTRPPLDGKWNVQTSPPKAIGGTRAPVGGGVWKQSPAPGFSSGRQ
jgi:hypothetical protein